MSYEIIPRTAIGLPATVTSSGPQAIRNIDAAARNRPVSAPFEYNYVIDQKDDSKIYEYAGWFQAAHSAGENSEAIGILLLNGTREAPTSMQIDKWRYLRDRYLIPNGVLRVNPDQRPHRQMPDAATSCPGSLILARWSEFLLPYQTTPTPIPPTPIPPTGGHVLLYKVVSGDSYWKICEKVTEDGKATNDRVAKIQQANGNKALQPGDYINIPGRVAV